MRARPLVYACGLIIVDVQTCDLVCYIHSHPVSQETSGPVLASSGILTRKSG